MKKLLLAFVTLLFLPLLALAATDWTVGLQELDLSRMSQGWGTPQVDKSVGGGSLAIGGRHFAHGVGTHAAGEFSLDLHGTARRFSAWVGVDDDAQTPGSAAAPTASCDSPTMRMTCVRILAASASRFSSTRAATPSPSRSRPSSRCSVPM